MWCADYIDGSGNRVQKFRATKEEADDVHSEGVKLSRQKIDPELPTTITVRDYAAGWLAQLETLVAARALKRATVESYGEKIEPSNGVVAPIASYQPAGLP